MRSFVKFCVDSVSGFFSRVAHWFEGDQAADKAASAEVDQAIDKIDPLAREIIAKYPLRTLKQDISYFVAMLDDFSGISRQLASLLDVLIKEAETFDEKTGPEKKEFVTAVVLKIYQKYETDLPRLPEFLEETVIRMIVGIAIDSIVQVFNKNLVAFQANGRSLRFVPSAEPERKIPIVPRDLRKERGVGRT
jgi:hypothetical protein